jgi:tRNA dimethylallyltransferase
LRLAEDVGTEILSVDSMQVYRGMDIGTAKATPDEQARVPHHMIDLVEPEDEFTVAEFQERARRLLDRPMVLVGGSGLHFRAIVDPLTFPPSDPRIRGEIEALDKAEAVEALEAIDPDAGAVIDLTNPRRVLRALEIHRLTGMTPSERAASEEADAIRSYRSAVAFRAVGLDPGPLLEDRVRRRLGRMVDRGLVEEVGRLGPHLGRTASQAVGYRQLLPVVRGELSLEEGVAAATRATLRLAKRQRTYFRRDPRIVWVPWDEDADTMYREVRAAFEEALR